MIAVCRLAVSQEGGRAAVADDRGLQAGSKPGEGSGDVRRRMEPESEGAVRPARGEAEGGRRGEGGNGQPDGRKTGIGQK